MQRLELSPRFADALRYATEVHGDHWRKGTGIPYVAHLLAVAALVLEDGGEEDEAIAALLHDAAEDRGGQARLDEIASRYGDRVAELVRACSDTLAPEDGKEPWEERKQAYLRHLEDADEQVLRISCADKLHNARAILRDLRSLGPELWERFSASPEQVRWYYRSLAQVFLRRRPGPLAGDLAAVVGEIECAAAYAQAGDDGGYDVDVGSAPGARPDAVERLQVDAAFRERFADRRRIAPGIESAEAEGATWLLVDDDADAGMRDPDDDAGPSVRLVRAERYDDRMRFFRAMEVLNARGRGR